MKPRPEVAVCLVITHTTKIEVLKNRAWEDPSYAKVAVGTKSGTNSGRTSYTAQQFVLKDGDIFQISLVDNDLMYFKNKNEEMEIGTARVYDNKSIGTYLKRAAKFCAPVVNTIISAAVSGAVTGAIGGAIGGSVQVPSGAVSEAIGGSVQVPSGGSVQIPSDGSVQVPSIE